MSFADLILIAVGLSMDAFAVAVCAGLGLPKVTAPKALAVGLYFGVFQAIMPFAGYMLATQFYGYVNAFGHWIAFALLCLIGGKMIVGSFPKDSGAEMTYPSAKRSKAAEVSLRPGSMIPLAIATSIDALAVGASFAFLEVDIIPAVSYIGIITFLLSIAGVKIGSAFGMKFRSKAELAGGVILVFIGLRILLEGLL